MPSLLEKIRVQNALIALGQAGPFYAVSYDKDTKLATEIDVLVDPAVAPAHVAANETSSAFAEDVRYGRSYRWARSGWTWQLACHFNQEVTGWRAEEEWRSSPPILARDEANGLTHQVTLLLQSASYEHPIKQGPHSGSRFTFIFEARLSRQ